MNKTPESEELENLFKQTQEKFAEGISIILRNINGKKLRLDALKNLTNIPSIEILRIVYKIGIEREDYETCDAIIEYCKINKIAI